MLDGHRDGPLCGEAWCSALLVAHSLCHAKKLQPGCAPSRHPHCVARAQSESNISCRVGGESGSLEEGESEVVAEVVSLEAGVPISDLIDLEDVRALHEGQGAIPPSQGGPHGKGPVRHFSRGPIFRAGKSAGNPRSTTIEGVIPAALVVCSLPSQSPCAALPFP